MIISSANCWFYISGSGVLFLQKLRIGLYSHRIYDSYMTTDMITIKLEDVFLHDIDGIVKNEGYQNRTEFIRNALREKIEEIKLRKAMMELAHLKGSAKKKTTEESYEKIRAKAFEEISKKLI